MPGVLRRRGSCSPATTSSAGDLRGRIERPDFLYISHLHGDHLDEAFLAEHVDRATTVLLPGFRPRRAGAAPPARSASSASCAPTTARRCELPAGSTVAIHVETSITDGPGGDSALVVTDGESPPRQPERLPAPRPRPPLTATAPSTIQWLQYSGAIWYPMVYDDADDVTRELADAKVEAQFARAMRYVEAVGARPSCPSAGPPCFLDPELFGLNVITGDELSIFPDPPRSSTASARRASTPASWRARARPSTSRRDRHRPPPVPDDEVAAIFADKRAYLARYQADWRRGSSASEGDVARAAARPGRAADGVVGAAAAPWRRRCGPASAPPACIRSGDVDILIDFPAGTVRAARRRALLRSPSTSPGTSSRRSWPTGPSTGPTRCSCRCRFRAWRAGEFNEYVYNFFKSLSPERMARAEAEAAGQARRRSTAPAEEIELGGYVMERYCPHRQADLSIFGERRRRRADLRPPRLAVRPRDRALPHRRRPPPCESGAPNRRHSATTPGRLQEVKEAPMARASIPGRQPSVPTVPELLARWGQRLHPRVSLQHPAVFETARELARILLEDPDEIGGALERFARRMGTHGWSLVDVATGWRGWATPPGPPAPRCGRSRPASPSARAGRPACCTAWPRTR